MRNVPVSPARLQSLRAAARLRVALGVVACALPLLASLAVIARVYAGRLLTIATPGIAAILVCVVLAFVVAFAARRARAYDWTWLARRLDATVPALEDSTALVLIPSANAPLTDLQRLQRERVRTRLESVAIPDLRPPWPRRVLAACAGAALLVVALAIAPTFVPARTPASREDAGATAIRVATVTIAPPAYTGVDAHDGHTLDVKAPAGSLLTWAITLDRPARSAALVFHDGERLALRADGETWRAERKLDESALYRIELEGAAPLAGDPLHRLEAVADRAPELTVRAPTQTLEVIDAQRETWELAVDATDDYGLGAATLSISHTQGSGEQIAVTTTEVALKGEGDARTRSFHHAIDLDALGFAEGDDVIARFSVADNREPDPNVASSASYILRWRPPAAPESAGMEGVVRRVMPAYFRSQRQLIIDTEALLEQRPHLDEHEYSSRADELGVDQKILRLRYGQFLGEEFAPEGEKAPVNENADQALLEEYGHIHDLPEAATLFDPVTKGVLRLALGEMWQSELRLRQAKLEDALPFEYKALDYIKQVQEAERVYLARVGVELPQIDPERRLTGERKDLGDRELAPAPETPGASPATDVWSALAHGADADLDALQGWAVRNANDVPDAMGLLLAIDRLRRDRTCSTCRDALAARLWPLVPPPATAVVPRAAPDESDAAYLDALGRAVQ